MVSGLDYSTILLFYYFIAEKPEYRGELISPERNSSCLKLEFECASVFTEVLGLSLFINANKYFSSP